MDAWNLITVFSVLFFFFFFKFVDACMILFRFVFQ